MQGVVKSYDPLTGDGIVVSDSGGGEEFDFAPGALDGSIFRMLRQGQRIIFDVATDGTATEIRLGSELDMGTPGFVPSVGADALPIAEEPQRSMS